MLEPSRAPAPGLAQVVDEIAGHVLAAPVAHEAGGGQLAHIGIDEGVAGAALGPALEGSAVGRGRFGVLAAQARQPKKIGPSTAGEQPEVVAPHQFHPQLLRAFAVGAGIGLVVVDSRPDLPGRKAAIGQPGRKLRAVRLPQQLVAGIVVAGNEPALGGVVVEAGQGGRFAAAQRGQGRARVAGRRSGHRQAQRRRQRGGCGQRRAGKPHRQRRQLLGCGLRWAHGRGSGHVEPEFAKRERQVAHVDAKVPRVQQGQGFEAAQRDGRAGSCQRDGQGAFGSGFLVSVLGAGPQGIEVQGLR